jgi:hypothetical protein
MNKTINDYAERIVENKMATFLPGAVLLKQWFLDHNVSARRFALDNGLDGSELSKVLRGIRKAVGVEFAVRVEDGTKSAVPVRAWVPRKLEDEHERV